MENLHCALRIRLAKENIFFGPGVVSLLECIKECESLNSAAKKINLSYSKANKMIKGAEEALGFKLLERKIGGIYGGGSTLTPECIDFLEKYLILEQEIKTFSDDLLEKIFESYL
ncbi:molybdate transport system regulatory protein [Sedimentibacter acidaminivorans]|uniref:Molybdate transport system regulatory protein n=1 Tax=Sedimentibacter acidaminivorans TaxID=913099 RepID=A0ABS4GIC7_9FIRM|nr:LysR family transcriptional regulator [Sedimentibacter acidaminivorans]MBP1927414.1 molybdate transport system regulatory protein [Sedimentibacter acidaminivorans]